MKRTTCIDSKRLEYTPFTWYSKISFIEWLMQNEAVFTNTKTPILNEPVSFDIETTSFRKNGEKYATMYVWAFDIYDRTFIGRTWKEFIELIETLSRFYDLKKTKRKIYIYIHNLSYEFQWFHKYFKWSKVFAVDSRTVLYALSEANIEFRCSYLLYGSNLAEMGKEVQKISKRLDNSVLEKLPDYNYELPRHYKTTLTNDELEYVIHDVKIVSEYIRIQIQEENGIDEIPRTRTGYVRRMCQYLCLYDYKNGKNYREFIQTLTLSFDEYTDAKQAFAGGYTHCAIQYEGVLLENVTSYDFSSSYPAVMLANKFPMNKGIKIITEKRDEFEKYMHEELCIVTVTLTNLKPIFMHDFYISKSKCEVAENAVTSNGRIYSADRITITLTSIDYRVIEKTYKFDIESIGVIWYYKSWYLPRSIIQAILELYGKKTTLKGVKGSEMEYMLSKGMLNSIYGMSVTDILRDVFGYDYSTGEWKPTEHVFKMERAKQDELIEKANMSKGRFLFFLWGVFVTAFARANLWSGIIECGTDYVYSDTDSIKVLNIEKHMDYIRRYNAGIREMIDHTLTVRGFNPELSRPKTKKGEVKQIGIWDFDGHYKYFKALGAKRYMYIETDSDTKIDELHITIGGVSKTLGRDWFLSKTRYPIVNDCTNDSKAEIKYMFSLLDKDTVIPKEYTGKMIHSYGDDEYKMNFTDYNGVCAEIHELTFVHLESCEYHMKSNYLDEFRQFIRFMKSKG